MNNAAIIMASVSIILTIVTSIFSVLAYCNVIGLKNSTHRMEFMPMDPNPDHLDDPDKEPPLPRFDRDGNEVKKPESQVFMEMQEHMYPDIDEEQV